MKNFPKFSKSQNLVIRSSDSASPLTIFIDFHWFSLIFIDFYKKSWKLMVLSGPKVLPHLSLCQKRRASCFCFPRKKNIFFHEKYFFCTLHYSTALPEASSIMKITNFLKSHDFHWLSLIFIDFGQKSWKLMVFNAAGLLPHPVLGQK